MNLFNNGPDNSLLSDGAKPQPDPLLTSYDINMLLQFVTPLDTSYGIDLMFVKFSANNLFLATDLLSAMFYCDITDHLPCFISIKGNTHMNMNNRPKIRLFDEKNCNKFTELMTLTDWDSLYLAETDWKTAFISTVKRNYEMSFPLVHVSRSRIKDKPWITKGLKQSIRNNHKLYRLSIHDGNNDSKTKYRKYKNILRTCIKSAEENFYKSLFEDTRTSSYNMWRSLGPVINPGNIRNELLYPKWGVMDRSPQMTRLFPIIWIKFFCNIGKQLQSGIPNYGDDYKRYLPQTIDKTFFLTPVHYDELIKEIKSLNPKKSIGPGNISAKIINLCPNIFAENLTKIFNRAIEKCEYPVQMKMAKVIALYKKGKRYEANNYRPISLLSISNKLLEKLLCRRVMKFLNANNILFKFQYGFRKLHSTTHALIEFTDSVRRFLDDGNYVINIFVDLTKAFDTVDHEILSYKLDRYGIHGHANDFFRTYLTNRFQYTVYGTSWAFSHYRQVGCDPVFYFTDSWYG